MSVFTVQEIIATSNEGRRQATERCLKIIHREADRELEFYDERDWEGLRPFIERLVRKIEDENDFGE